MLVSGGGIVEEALWFGGILTGFQKCYKLPWFTCINVYASHLMAFSYLFLPLSNINAVSY